MAIVTDGLVLYLHGACGKNNPATRVWKDLSGNGNDGQLMNFDFDDKSGWTNNGLKFDGIDDKTNIDFQINQDDTFSIEQSFYIHEITGNMFLMFITTNSRSKDYGAIWYSNNNRIYFPYLFGRSVRTRKGIDYIIGHHHITIIYDAQKQFLEVYHNGINLNLENNSPYEFTIDSIQPCWYTGTKTSMTLNLFRIYNRALTDEEIMQNYQAGHEWTPVKGKREVTTTMKPITTSLSRKGKGKRELISTMKPITTSLERKGKGKREATTTMKPITSSLSRKGVGKREVTTTIKPITSSISKKLPPIHANMDIRERIPKLEVD